MRNNDRLKTEYLCYLMNRAQVDAEGSRGYLYLCEILQDTEFLPLLEMDENRCRDCEQLRQDYADDYDDEAGDILDEIYGENCTMMELLVTLAERISFDLADSEYEASTRKWFLEMLENCGLAEFCNERHEENEEQFEDSVRTILTAVIFRKIGWDGEGGLFPLRWPRQDQRYCELIIQMNNYIEENYDIC